MQGGRHDGHVILLATPSSTWRSRSVTGWTPGGQRRRRQLVVDGARAVHEVPAAVGPRFRKPCRASMSTPSVGSSRNTTAGRPTKARRTATGPAGRPTP